MSYTSTKLVLVFKGKYVNIQKLNKWICFIDGIGLETIIIFFMIWMCNCRLTFIYHLSLTLIYVTLKETSTLKKGRIKYQFDLKLTGTKCYFTYPSKNELILIYRTCLLRLIMKNIERLCKVYIIRAFNRYCQL